MQLLDRDRPMQAIHRKTGKVGHVKKVDQSKALLVGKGFDSWIAYFDRYGQPKDEFCPWFVRNVEPKSAFEGIKAGLEDAITYVHGDTSRGKVVAGVDWFKPIEAVHDDGRVGIVEPHAMPGHGQMRYAGIAGVGYMDAYKDGWREDGSPMSSSNPWRIRNVQSCTDAVMELGREHKVGYDPIPNSVELKWSEPETDTIPVDRALWERVVGLVRGMDAAGDDGYAWDRGKYSSRHYDEARAIADLLPAVEAEDDLIEARKIAADALGEPETAKLIIAGKSDNSAWVKSAIAAIARGRALERGDG